MSLDDFQPDSHFGVPLTTIPPGLPWSMTRDMIREVLSDLTMPWVRKYLFDENAAFDISVLSNNLLMQRALVTAMSTQTMKDKSGGFDGAYRSTRISIPSSSIGDLGLGIQVDATSEVGVRNVVFEAPFKVCRYVSNSSKMSSISVYFRGETVNINYQRHTPHGLWYFANLFFDRGMLMKAVFNGKDLDTAQRALTRSIAGGMQHKKTLQLTDRRYPYKISENYGTHCLPAVMCSYANAMPMMSLSLFGAAEFSFGSDATYIANIRKWALGDRLSRVAIPPIHVPRLQNDDSGVFIEEMPHENEHVPRSDPALEQEACTQHVHTLTGPRKLHRIAPAPVNSPAKNVEQLTPEEEAKRLRAAKEERRKSQRRESAARFNEMKKAQRLKQEQK